MTKNYPIQVNPFYSLVALLFFCSFNVFFNPMLKGQDIHFTQFDFAPLLINASNTGNFNGDMRISGNFRNQQGALANPYRTALISFDRQVFLLNQKLGIGAYFVNDESGAGKLTFNKLYASLAYNTTVNNNGFGIGLQVGYVTGGYTDWGNFNRSTGNFDAPSGENMLSLKTGYADINAGIYFKRSIKKIEPELGFSLLHLNKPPKTFIDDKGTKEDMRLISYALVKTNITDKIYFTPKFFFSAKSSLNELIAGAEAGYKLIGVKSTVKKLFGGAYIRNGQSGMGSIMVQAGATVSRIDIALSYDMYMSGINDTGARNAFEISFVYKSISTLLNSYSIPCERY
ncbi:MAG: PorP/SprF family type IX secretion system membrane protein [Bacteroidales bacterium]|nr:PorP/SprF family type IX secretion system membrane protein [Bacteroidales bacterium]